MPYIEIKTLAAVGGPKNPKNESQKSQKSQKRCQTKQFFLRMQSEKATRLKNVTKQSIPFLGCYHATSRDPKNVQKRATGSRREG